MTPKSALRHYWYPVATADEVAAAPRAARLLGERLVLWRAGGQVVAFQDLCIHRGTPLSLGWVDGETLVCAYHGWAYGAAGACVRIPAVPPERAIPRKARATAYRAQEAYGLVWVCLDEPRAPLPAFPEYADPAYQTYWRQFEWQAGAARMIENVMDFAHLPWVHEGLLGDRSRPVPPRIAVEVDGNTLRYAVDVESEVRVYRVDLPYTMHLVKRDRDPAVPERRALLFACCPLSERETRLYFGVARNFGLDGSDDAFKQLNATVMEQDRGIVESQRPEELPLDLSAELHLRGPDAAAVEYRRALARLGVTP